MLHTTWGQPLRSAEIKDICQVTFIMGNGHNSSVINGKTLPFGKKKGGEKEVVEGKEVKC